VTTVAASIAERYILLGLRLGNHVDGLVDGYFGPPELQAAVEDAEPPPPQELLGEANALLEELDSADDLDDAQRRRWLAGQLRGLACVAEMASGTEVPWPDAVTRCYGLDVGPVPEQRFAAAHDRLEQALPGDGDLAARLQAWNRSQEIPADKLLVAFDALADALRAETRELVDLPENERLDRELVTGKPWGAYNWYLGNRRSRIDIATDLPSRAYYFAELVAHEGYPGHHTEHACKEARLVDALGRIEASVLLIHTPECLVSEGIAQVAIEQAFGDKWQARAAEILRPVGIEFDAETASAVNAANVDLDHVGVNIAHFASVEGWSTERCIEYHQRWALSEEHRAQKAVEFATHPMWSVYVPTYSYGYHLARAYTERHADGLTRLLTEQLTTVDLLAAPAPA
jgi:hypothetical protein